MQRLARVTLLLLVILAATAPEASAHYARSNAWGYGYVGANTDGPGHRGAVIEVCDTAPDGLYVYVVGLDSYGNWAVGKEDENGSSSGCSHYDTGSWTLAGHAVAVYTRGGAWVTSGPWIYH